MLRCVHTGRASVRVSSQQLPIGEPLSSLPCCFNNDLFFKLFLLFFTRSDSKNTKVKHLREEGGMGVSEKKAGEFDFGTIRGTLRWD